MAYLSTSFFAPTPDDLNLGSLTLFKDEDFGPGFVDVGLHATDATSVTPEPSSFVLLGTGLLGAAGILRKRFT